MCALPADHFIPSVLLPALKSGKHAHVPSYLEQRKDHDDPTSPVVGRCCLGVAIREAQDRGLIDDSTATGFRDIADQLNDGATLTSTQAAILGMNVYRDDRSLTSDLIQLNDSLRGRLEGYAPVIEYLEEYVETGELPNNERYREIHRT